MKNKGGKVIAIIAVIILIVILLFIGRNILIISKLSDNAEKTIKSNNYHRTTYIYNLGKYSKEEVFQLGDKKKIVLTELKDNKITTTTMFANKTENAYLVNTYGESNEEKIAQLNQKMGLLGQDLENEFYNENWLNYALTSIKTTKFNGEECYYINNFKGSGIYINKDTGLPISVMGHEYEDLKENQEKYETRSAIYEYLYEFNTVTEEDFVEPNISEYQVQS